jgi:hypothetical protein
VRGRRCSPTSKVCDLKSATKRKVRIVRRSEVAGRGADIEDHLAAGKQFRFEHHHGVSRAFLLPPAAAECMAFLFKIEVAQWNDDLDFFTSTETSKDSLTTTTLQTQGPPTADRTVHGLAASDDDHPRSNIG